MKDAFDYKFEVLLKEYDALQAMIRHYDGILFRIKSWAITLFSGFLLFAAKEASTVYLLLGSAAVILFWTMDGIFKGFQREFITRHNKVEHFLRRPEFMEAVEKRDFGKFNLPDISGRVSVRDRSRKISPWRAAIYWHTSILYLAMLGLLAIAMVLFMCTGT